MTIQNNFPAIKPTLSLDFANVKQLDPRITFSRASTATYYGTQTAKAEENLLLQSQTFENVAWGGGLGTTRTANTNTAPDGTTTADTITEDSATSVHVIVQAAAASGQVTLSVFAKAGSGSRFLTIGVSRAATHYGSATFDLSTQTSTQTLIAGYSGSVTTAVSASASAQGFYRYSITVTTDTISDVRIGLNATSTFSNFSRGFDSYSGDGTSNLILWGAQLEARSAATAYTPTTTQAITNYVSQLLTSASGVARFDHNPVTDESLGLLIEEQRTNLLLRSEEFDNVNWGKSNSTVTVNAVVSPDGAIAADKLVENTATSSHSIAQSVSVTSGTTYTFTVYAKAAERSRILIAVASSAFTANQAIFNLGNGTTSSVVACTASMTLVGNGWYRCSWTATATASAFPGFNIFLDNGSTPTYTGDGYSGVFIWGAQVEVGAFSTSYIPTVASQVTRAADVAVMTGTNFSSWYNQAEGTLFVQGVIPFVGGSFFPSFASVDNGTSSGAIEWSMWDAASDSVRFVVWDGGVSQASIVAGTYAANTLLNLAGAYKVNDFAASYNGANAVTDSAGTLPTVTLLRIGQNRAAGNPLNGCIRKIAYYPMRVTNTQLQSLTT
jgi:hypothetical protein